jgi:hypothetical protein
VYSFEPADPADGLPELRDEDMQSLFGDDNQEEQGQQRRRGPGSDYGTMVGCGAEWACVQAYRIDSKKMLTWVMA